MIRECAFAGCTLDKLYIFETVKSIHPYAFVNIYFAVNFPMKRKYYFPNPYFEYFTDKAAHTLKSSKPTHEIGKCTPEIYDNARNNLYIDRNLCSYISRAPYVADILYYSEKVAQSKECIREIYRVIDNSNSTPSIYQFNYTDTPVFVKFMFQTGTIKNLTMETFSSKLKELCNSKHLPINPHNISVLHIQDPSINIDNDMDFNASSKKWDKLKSVYVDFSTDGKTKKRISNNLLNLQNIASSLPRNVKKFGLILDRPIKESKALKYLTYNSLQKHFPTSNIALYIIRDSLCSRT